MLRNYVAYFVVECYGDRIYEEAGFYPAATYTEAMAYIEEFYGEELAIVKHLELLDTSMITMQPEIAAQLVKETFD